MANKVEKEKFLKYKGKPLVRCGNTLYYGDMNDKYVVMLQILTTKEVDGFESSDRVLIQLLSTDTNLRPRERVIKKSEKQGLYNAMDIGSIWLHRALADEEKEKNKN